MKKILIVLADYYEDISSLLLKSAKNNLNNFSLKVIKVPGVFEIPITISKNIKKYDAFLALGCVIKGETPHFDLICSEISRAFMSLALETEKPIIHGVLTVNSYEQAMARCGLMLEEEVSEDTTQGKKVVHNKGQESAETALTMLRLLKGSEF